MHKKIKIRKKVWDIFWYWVKERQNIFYKRLRGEPAPWTNDKIFQTYKFTNAYRVCDRTSQYLLKNVIYCANKKEFDERDIVFRILLFKIFNKIETWKALENKFGVIKASNFDFESYYNFIRDLNNKQAVLSSAYMLSTASPKYLYGMPTRFGNYLMFLNTAIFKDKLYKRIIGAKCLSLRFVYKLLLQYKGLSRFLAYQYSIDLNYSELINFDEDSFVVAGGGALRGIEKMVVDHDKCKPEHIIMKMVKEQNRTSFSHYNLFGRDLKAIDLQNVFCEVDKYTRVKYPELDYKLGFAKLGKLKRIKHKFVSNDEPINYFFPPKWRITKKKIKQRMKS
ncbi:MAG: hypothetical protein GF317_04960 [Candidatus Lokiarchaeota archaeon]|nr:hypothetical protein [Candidatus Lokiarchaeota archaeon]